MFDIAFSELVVVALVALIVVGPERLPKLARTAGHLWGRVQRYVNNVKHDINNDLALEEARKLKSDLEQQAVEIEQSVQERSRALEQQAVELERNLQADGLTLEQHILQARYKKPDAAEAGAPPAPTPAPPEDPTK
ncbi:MAG: twin-arginine translocase subunit TatB [Nitrosomonadales bacterium]|nr:twin-arginine translocase subunit TatB [Nitrosomonadales bacterium]